MSAVGQDLLDTAPALAFLCLGVPFAALLDRLGTFDAIVSWIGARRGDVRTGLLWAIAAAVTALLNLDTTIVLLTPIAIRLARRSGDDPLPVAAIPLLLSAFASSFLPISNLTNLIVAGRADVDTWSMLTTLGPAALAATLAGWILHRRRVPTRLIATDGPEPDRVALRFGGVVIASTVVGFVVGQPLGIAPWVVVLLADVVLATRLRWVPWREIPIGTAVGVGTLVALVSWSGVSAGTWVLGGGAGPAGVAAVAAGVLASAVNNLPATLIGLGSVRSMTDGAWGWLYGVNAGSLLLPWGTLATVLWWRVLRSEGVEVRAGSYLRTVLPAAVPAFLVGTLVLVATAAFR